MKPLFTGAMLLLAPFALNLTFSDTASAALNCDSIEGSWAGTMSGAYRGKTTMEIKKCKLKWRLPDGRLNRCRYKEKSDYIEYSCSLGSHGKVKINGNKIVMQNVFTAHRHGKYTVSVRKTGS